MEHLKLFSDRRSLPPTRMNGTAIPEAHLQAILEAANWAPSHRHTEPWRFIVYAGKGRQKLCDAMIDAYTQHAGQHTKEAKIEKLGCRTELAGAMIALILSVPQPARNPEEEDVMAVACATQNLHLAAHGLGIGGYWTTPGFADHALFREFLNLKLWERCLGVFYLGYPASDWPISKRQPVAKKIHYVLE